VSLMTITARNVNDALIEGSWWLHVAGKSATTRNGTVRRAPGPVITTYTKPQERVLFNKKRDANPFFHFMEALWMLCGSNRVDFVAQYVPRMLEYSDDGVTLHGAYGARWGVQPDVIGAHLASNPTSRRAVINIWDHTKDLGRLNTGRDLPCNTNVYFSAARGVLDMTVCCRSNDMLWGAYGANAVHFSVLQEYIATLTKLEMGTYTQFSNDFHLYDNAGWELPVLSDGTESRYGSIKPYQIVNEDLSSWREDLRLFIFSGHREPRANDYQTKQFRETVAPMQRAWLQYKSDALTFAITTAQEIAATDWSLACAEWLQRRVERRDAKSK